MSTWVLMAAVETEAFDAIWRNKGQVPVVVAGILIAKEAMGLYRIVPLSQSPTSRLDPRLGIILRRLDTVHNHQLGKAQAYREATSSTMLGVAAPEVVTQIAYLAMRHQETSLNEQRKMKCSEQTREPTRCRSTEKARQSVFEGRRRKQNVTCGSRTSMQVEHLSPELLPAMPLLNLNPHQWAS